MYDCMNNRRRSSDSVPLRGPDNVDDDELGIMIGNAPRKTARSALKMVIGATDRRRSDF